MKDITPKQAAIKAAYGDAWEKVESDADKDGWVSSKSWYWEELGFAIQDIHIDPEVSMINYWRPASLTGIEDNNGWIRADEKLPNHEGNVHYCIDGKYAGELSVKYWLIYHANDSLGLYSHWRPVEKLPDPVY